MAENEIRLEANGLTLKTIRSKAEPVSVKETIFELLPRYFDIDKQAYIVAYLDYRVISGIYENDQMRFPDGVTLSDKDGERYIQRLRVFNESRELLVWRTNNGFKGRIRIDNEGEHTEVVDAKQVLWGTKVVRNTGDFTELTEDRGTTLIVPLKDVKVDDKKSRAFLKTRNYIGYTDACQATYVDSRFMGFGVFHVTKKG